MKGKTETSPHTQYYLNWIFWISPFFVDTDQWCWTKQVTCA